jgi:hypothetical protein
MADRVSGYTTRNIGWECLMGTVTWLAGMEEGKVEGAAETDGETLEERECFRGRSLRGGFRTAG